jgi:hypothetical protein
MKMMRNYHFALYSIVLITSSLAFSQTPITDPQAVQACASVEQVEPPAADRPTVAEEKALANCSSLDAYFGFGQPVDLVKARKCAYAEVDRGSKFALGGRAILTMVYANGKGAARSFDVALKMACSIHDAPGDATGRIYQLLRAKKANWTGDNFSICDHSSAPELYEQCAILGSRFDEIERNKHLEKITASWNPRDKKAFNALWNEGQKFANVQAKNGVDLSGTFEIQEEDFWRNHIVESLEQFERGELPKHSDEEARSAASAEAAAYNKTETGDASHWGTVTHASVKTSEDEWHRYRSAWITFGKQKYPSVTEASWTVWLDQERTNMLNKLPH